MLLQCFRCELNPMDYQVQTIQQLRQYIIGLRKSAGLTQKAAGELLGLTQQGYQRLEASPEIVSVERMMKILQTFNASLVVRENKKPESKSQIREQSGSGNLYKPNPRASKIADTALQSPNPLSKEKTPIRIKTPTGKKGEW